MNEITNFKAVLYWALKKKPGWWLQKITEMVKNNRNSETAPNSMLTDQQNPQKQIHINPFSEVIHWTSTKKCSNDLHPDGTKPLTHWGWETHICVSNLTIIGSDNGLSPGRRQAIILTNAGILLIGPLGTNFSGILIEIQTFSFKKMRLKVSSAKWRPFCFGLNVLNDSMLPYHQEWHSLEGNFTGYGQATNH